MSHLMNDNKQINSVVEDTVQCYFFPTSLEAHQLEKICNEINMTIENLSTGYIWHRDEFKVYQPLKKDIDAPDIPHLISVTGFGDNIEDEWFIVYLILEITRIHDVIVQMKDNDGDFLLIEAADYLPSWINPENTENRVFIYKNKVHIIPPNLLNREKELHLTEALNIICQFSQKTQASSNIQGAIVNRIGNYPEKIEESFHRTTITLPIDIACLLKIRPSFIAPIVTTYCNRDVIDAKLCKNIQYENCVDVRVQFTKCLYAMLNHSDLINSIRYFKLNQNKKNVLGLKLTCGYQMIMGRLKDIFKTKEYEKFIKSLKSNGYFKENLEGSKDYKILLEKAKHFFLNMECPINTHVCDSITALMSTEEFKNMRESLLCGKISEESIPDDNEDWLKIHPEQLNNLLNSRYGKQAKFNSDDVISAETVTSELSKFLKQTSDFEGIETRREESDDQIQFDSDEFINSVQRMMNLAINGDEDKDTDETSDDSDMDSRDNDSITEDIDKVISEELNEKLQGGIASLHNKEDMLSNMKQSIKEEGGASGPSSNLLRIIGYNKTDILDSDDDEA